MFREVADGVRDEDIDDVKEGFRPWPGLLAPTREVAFTCDLELGVGAAMDLGSPALSTSVFRLGSGSYAALILCLRKFGGAIFENSFDRALLSDSEISARLWLWLFPKDGICDGGRGSCDVRILEFSSE